jgi:hypothetical protein
VGEGADVNALFGSYGKALQAASRWGHEAVVISYGHTLKNVLRIIISRSNAKKAFPTGLWAARCLDGGV